MPVLNSTMKYGEKSKPLSEGFARAREHLGSLVKMASKASAPADGTTQTIIPFLSIIKSSKPTAVRQGVLTPSFCVVVQGTKKFYLGREIVRYGAGNFLAALIDMPSAGQIVGAAKTEPYLGIRMDVTQEETASVAMDAKLNMSLRPGVKRSAGAFVGKTDPDVLEALVRLLRLLDKPQDAAFLAPSIKREIIYRLLMGVDGQFFFQNTVLDSQTLALGRSIKWLKENFDRDFVIEDLAKSSNMSVSSLRHKFKVVTTMGPLQYQKHLRLQEARRLLLGGTVDATTAALQVGYESPSQFSREYRRLFGLPPLEDLKLIRQGTAISDLQD
jgi:AraC-like DNA-binding protein